MSKKKYDRAIFIGRCQPLHNGHMKIINRAKELADQVIILVGSSGASVSMKNPFTFEQRAEMIHQCVEDVIVRPIYDYSYNDQKWVSCVRETVNSVPTPWTDEYPTKTCIVGYKKDNSSFYLDLFPDWKFVSVDFDDNINATDIREIMYNKKKSFDLLTGVVPKKVFSYLNEFSDTQQYRNLSDEYFFIKEYKQQFAGMKYPPMFVTVDAVVVQSGHVLLVERKANPGKGLLAIPGGFLNQNERIVDAMIRELREETKLKVPSPVLIGSIKKNHVFDAPDRSARGRTITHAYYIELTPTEFDAKLPNVKGCDDARTAKWYPINELKSTDFFEDHFQIIQFFSGV